MICTFESFQRTGILYYFQPCLWVPSGTEMCASLTNVPTCGTLVVLLHRGRISVGALRGRSLLLWTFLLLLPSEECCVAYDQVLLVCLRTRRQNNTNWFHYSSKKSISMSLNDSTKVGIFNDKQNMIERNLPWNS